MQLQFKHIIQIQLQFMSGDTEENMAAIFFRKRTLNDVIFILAEFSRIGPVFLVLSDLLCPPHIDLVQIPSASASASASVSS